MRVLWWTCNFWPIIGGVEVLGTGLITRLRDRGYDLAVVAQSMGGKLPAVDSFEGIPIYRFPFYHSLDNADLAEIARVRNQLSELADEFRPHLVHLHSLVAQTLFYTMVFASRSHRLLITRHEFLDSNQAVGPDTVPARLMRSADWVTSCSDAVLEESRRLVPEIAPRSSTILNALARPDLVPGELPFEPPRFLCLGRLETQKGFDVALEAFARLVADYPSAHLVLAGDGPARGELQERAATLGLADSVTFRGWVPPGEVPRLLDDSTIVIMPSRYGEGFGLVALEAMQMGRPVIASRVGGLPEVVVDGDTGLLVEPGDVTALTGAMRGFLDEPELARQYGEAGLRHSEHFTMDRYAMEYDLLYRQLIEESIDVTAS